MPRVQMSIICRKGLMCQSCLTAALCIVSSSLFLLSGFLASNGNGKLSLDGYFMHQQSVFYHLWRWRAPSVNLQTIQTLNSWPLRIAPAHSRVGRERACYNKSRLTGCENACRRNTAERRNHWRACCAAAELYDILPKVQPSSLRNCSSIKLVQL